MKRIGILLLILMCISLPASGQVNDAVARRLKHFYSYYILENDRMPLGTKFSDDTLKKYCTASFLKRTSEDSELDFDPITYFQDFDTDWVKTLKVTRLTSTNGKIKKYHVCFWYDYEHVNHCITVYMRKESGQWKIDKTCRKGNCNG